MNVTRLNAVFWVFWFVVLFFCYFNSYDDPSSIFYNASKAHQPRFSLLRAAEAEHYLRNTTQKPAPGGARNKFLCLGIPSANRTNPFLPYTLATLTDSLTTKERQSIHIVVLLADASPRSNFAYRKSWLEDIADEILVYNQVPTVSTDLYRTIPYDLTGLGRSSDPIENTRLDHSALAAACRRQESKYFALVEDDIVASRDWFPRLKKGLAHVEKQTERNERDWMYLRMFYSEMYMGWNSEEWFTYSRNIVLVYAVVIFVIWASRMRCRIPYTKAKPAAGPPPSSRSAQSSRSLVVLVLGVWLPSLIALFFFAGRISVNRLNPMTKVSHGVREMPRYGCCAQGLVFPQRHVRALQGILREAPFDSNGDQVVEGHAASQGLSKWALDPSVFQHVGAQDPSHGDGKTEVWNFSFERQHAQ